MPNVDLAIPVAPRSLFIGDKNPDYILDTDEELVELAKELGATHIRLPYGVLGGALLQKRELGFYILARFGNIKDGRIFVNNYYGGLHYGLENIDLLTEL